MYKVDAGKKTDICNSPNRFSHSDNGQPLNYREFHIISFSEKDVVWTFTIPPKKWLTELFFFRRNNWMMWSKSVPPLVLLLPWLEMVVSSLGATTTLERTLGSGVEWRLEEMKRHTFPLKTTRGGDVSRVVFCFFLRGGVRVLGVDFGWFETLLLLADLVLLFLTGTNTYRSYSKSPHSMLILFHILVVSSFDSWHHIPVGDP